MTDKKWAAAGESDGDPNIPYAGNTAPPRAGIPMETAGEGYSDGGDVPRVVTIYAYIPEWPT
jgi:hypothetical protein